MKRSLMIFGAALMVLVGTVQSHADDVHLTLDLKNSLKGNAAGGGTWQLYARVMDTAGADGTPGLAGISAYLENISSTGITFASDINANGAADFQDYGGGITEIVYGQDLSLATTAGIGVAFATPNLDRLIASGTWPAGAARPVFSTTELSDANFLVAGGGESIPPAALSTSVVTLGDYNNSGTITFGDISGLVADLQGGADNPAGDINQSGTITFGDISGFVAILQGPSAPAVSAVPEPSSIGLAIFASMGLIARRRRV